MSTLLDLLSGLLPFLYGGLVGVYLHLLLRDGAGAKRVAEPLLAGTVTLHLLFLAGEAVLLDRHPMANKFEIFTFVAFIVAASYLWVERRRGNSCTGVFPLSLALLLQVCASLGRPTRVEVPEILDNPLFAWHAGAATAALAAFSVGAVYGVLFLVQYRALKRGRLGEVAMRMPSMDVLSRMSLHAGEVGWVALTLTVGLGDIWVSETPTITLADPKVWTTFLVWGIYSLALGGHFFRRWGGWRVVTLNLSAYALLVGSLLTVGRVFDTFHRFTG